MTPTISKWVALAVSSGIAPLISPAIILAQLSPSQSSVPPIVAHTSNVSSAWPYRTPPLIEIRGELEREIGRPLTGTIGVTFSLYPEQEGGTPLWLETQNLTLDADGQYHTSLGVNNSGGILSELFASGEARWLGVQVLLPGERERPRIQILSVPYALMAADAETLGGKPWTAFVLAPQADAESATLDSDGAMDGATTKTGTSIVSNPHTTQTITAPPLSGIPLQIRGQPNNNSNLLEIYEAPPNSRVQSYFSPSGALFTSKAPTFSSMPVGSILFSGTGGLLSQDNGHFAWDNTAKELRVGPRASDFPSGILRDIAFPQGGSIISRLNTGAHGARTFQVLNSDNTTTSKVPVSWLLEATNRSPSSSKVVEDVTLYNTGSGGTAGGFRGTDMYLEHTGTGSIGHLWGLNTYLSFGGFDQVSTAGNVGFVRGLYTGGDRAGSGFVTEWQGVFVDSITNTGGTGSISNLYGVKIEDQTTGINNWALKTGSGLVQFGDKVLADKALIEAYVSVTPSATTTFDATLGNAFQIILTGDVNSSTLANAQAGQFIVWIICQDRTGDHKFSWPDNVRGGGTISGRQNTCSAQQFLYDGMNAYALADIKTGMQLGQE